MKQIHKQILMITILLLTILSITSCNNSTNTTKYVIDESDFIKGNELINNIEPSPLSEEEINGLILMREEEKLAKDVYLTLYDKWNINIFKNIASSEQTNTNAVKVLLDRYEIEDPVTNNEIGEFNSEMLDNLYKTLIEKGSESLSDALIVGATVEELDIKDLNELLYKKDNQDIVNTYNNLNKGSRNHLRAFMKQIKLNNENYTPPFISQSEFDNILSTEQERGRTK